MSGVIPDGLQMDSFAPAWMGVQKTEDLKTLVTGLSLGAGERDRTADLPFTRRRCVVPPRMSPILPLSRSVIGATFPQVAPYRNRLALDDWCRPGNLASWPCGLQKDSQGGVTS